MELLRDARNLSRFQLNTRPESMIQTKYKKLTQSSDGFSTGRPYRAPREKCQKVVPLSKILLYFYIVEQWRWSPCCLHLIFRIMHAIEGDNFFFRDHYIVETKKKVNTLKIGPFSFLGTIFGKANINAKYLKSTEKINQTEELVQLIVKTKLLKKGSDRPIMQ